MRALIQIGNMCNMTCSYCANRDWRDHKQCMSLDTLMATVNVLNRLHPSTVLLVGGEPTVYPHILTAVNQLTSSRLMILSNGLRSDVLSTITKTDKQFTIYVTVHHDYWQHDKSDYVRALLEDYQALCAGRQRGNVPWFRFKLLVDYKQMPSTVDIADWLMTNIAIDNIVVDGVRRTATQEEFVKNYIAAKRALPDVLVQKLMNMHNSLPIANEFYGQPCPQFVNHVIVNANGSVQSSLCPQPTMAEKTIDAPEFTLTPCTVTCRQQTIGGFENCRYCHGLTSDDDE